MVVRKPTEFLPQSHDLHLRISYMGRSDIHTAFDASLRIDIDATIHLFNAVTCFLDS